MVLNANAISAIHIDKNVGDDLVFRQISSRPFDLGLNPDKSRTDGVTDPRQVFISSANPSLMGVATTDVGRLLDFIDNEGAVVKTSLTDTMRFFFQKFASMGVLAGGGSDVQASIANALLLVSSIEMPGGDNPGPVVASTDIRISSSDGTTDPVTLSKTATATADATPAEQRFYLHSVEYEGTEIPGVTSATLSMNYQVTPSRNGSKPWNVDFAIEGREPVLTIRTDNMDYLNDIGTTGEAFSTGELNIWLQKGNTSSSAVRVLPATTSHIKIYGAAGRVIPTDAPKDLGLDFHFIDEAGAESLAWTVGVAIA